MSEEPVEPEALEEIPESGPPRILSTPNAPHPQAHITSVSEERGVATFRWLDTDGNAVDGGGSVAYFPPVAPVVDEDGSESFPAVTDDELILSIEMPPSGDLATPEQIKDEAHRRILAIVPMWKQNNFTAVALDIKTKDSPTAEDQAKLAAIQSIWDRVVAIRAYSDTLEANPPPVAELAIQNWPA